MRNSGNMASAVAVTPSMTITMYGAEWCGDCRRAKAWFAENDVDYTFIDLVEHPEQTDRVLELNSGVNRIPVIEFGDGSVLVEPTDQELHDHLAGLRTGQATNGAPVVENTHLGRFELLHEGQVVSFADFREHDGVVVIPHVETAPDHRGNGYAAELMEGVLAILRADDRLVRPLCPFAAAHIRDNPQHHDLVAR